MMGYGADKTMEKQIKRHNYEDQLYRRYELEKELRARKEDDKKLNEETMKKSEMRNFFHHQIVEKHEKHKFEKELEDQ
jgi:hypothetical protein